MRLRRSFRICSLLDEVVADSSLRWASKCTYVVTTAWRCLLTRERHAASAGPRWSVTIRTSSGGMEVRFGMFLQRGRSSAGWISSEMLVGGQCCLLALANLHVMQRSSVVNMLRKSVRVCSDVLLTRLATNVLRLPTSTCSRP